jgi:hypothetical protein
MYKGTENELQWNSHQLQKYPAITKPQLWDFYYKRLNNLKRFQFRVRAIGIGI